MRRAILAAAVAASVPLAAAPAHANGRFPASNAIVFSPTNPNLVVLRATYGIMPSYDYGSTWTWLCEDSLGLPPTSNEDPTLGLTFANAMVAGISTGLEVSPDTGCTWTFESQSGLKGQNIKDLVVRPDSPHTVLAVTSTYEMDAGTADGGSLYSQQVWVSTDDGAHWAPQGTPIDPTLIVTTIEVAATDPSRLYVSAYRDATPRTAWFLASTNGGTTWTEYPTPLDAQSETAVYIAAVDPQNENLVYVRSEGASRLFVTSDGGQSFQVAYALPNADQMEGFALSQDGSKVYLGGPTSGLYVASSSTLQFAQASTIHVQCLATHGSDLWACSDEATGHFVAGVSQDDGATFTSKLELNGISGPIQCAANTTAAQCTGNLYDTMCANLGGCLEADAGSDAGHVADGGPSATTASSKSSCGCSIVGGGGAAGAVAGVLVALATIGRRRRR